MCFENLLSLRSFAVIHFFFAFSGFSVTGFSVTGFPASRFYAFVFSELIMNNFGDFFFAAFVWMFANVFHNVK